MGRGEGGEGEVVGCLVCGMLVGVQFWGWEEGLGREGVVGWGKGGCVEGEEDLVGELFLAPSRPRSCRLLFALSISLVGVGRCVLRGVGEGRCGGLALVLVASLFDGLMVVWCS